VHDQATFSVTWRGTPIGTVTAPANRYDPPLLTKTLDVVAETLGGLPEQVSVHLDRGYDSNATHERLEERGLLTEIPHKGKPAPLPRTLAGFLLPHWVPSPFFLHGIIAYSRHQ
jgi:hypothetical protein